MASRMLPRLGDEDLSLPRAVEFVELVSGDPIEDDGAAGHVDPHREGLRRAEHTDQALLAAKWEVPRGQGGSKQSQQETTATEPMLPLLEELLGDFTQNRQHPSVMESDAPGKKLGWD